MNLNINNVYLDYDAANLFKKLLFIGAGSSSVVAIIYAIALHISIRAVTEFAFMGAVAIAGLSVFVVVFLIIPGIIGIGIYELYRILQE